MTETTEDLRIGLDIREAVDFWGEHGQDIVGVPGGTQPTEDETGRHLVEWSRGDLTGRVELIGDDDSTLARIKLEGDDPESELRQFLEPLSRALDEVESVEGASFTLEPDAGLAPDEETSSDQPL